MSRGEDKVSRKWKWVMVGGYWLVMCLIATEWVLKLGGLRNFVVGTDFRSFYAGGKLVVYGDREKLFTTGEQWKWQENEWPGLKEGGVLHFANPPWVAAIMGWLTFRPMEQAYLIWAVFNLAVWVWVVYSLCSEVRGEGERRWWWVAALSVFPPAVIAWFHGQFSIILVAVILAAGRRFKDNRDMAGGITLSLLSIKPQLLILPVLVLAVQRRWKALGGLAAGLGGLGVISLRIVGSEGLIRYGELLTRFWGWREKYGVNPARMHNWRGETYLWLGDSRAGMILWLAGIAAAAVWLVWVWRKRETGKRFYGQFTLLVLSMIWIGPYTNYHDLAVLAIPAVWGYVFVSDTAKNKKGVMLKILVAGVFLVSNISPVLGGFFPIQLSVLAVGGYLVWLSWIYRGAKAA